MSTLVRPVHGKMIAGVCAALANRFGWSVGVIRILAVLSCLLPGPQVIVYIAMWILIPREGRIARTRMVR
ncbi:PspC domain-containing protein [Amnibacterium flavum]|uniref:PspC domain-containing protein n=1 Tax=Amnibacterium flavum TaxID=2173173 RepID=A0A2V1HVW1_9MICO|nr:PspC domain-containing protein [Amnibacterium flavum]PVZ94324.1 PspC domain-containing protein [Amnibacterium flavum]